MSRPIIEHRLPEDTLEMIFYQYGCLYSFKGYQQTSLVCKEWKRLLDTIVARAFAWFLPVYTIVHQAHQEFFTLYKYGKWIRSAKHYFSENYFKSRFVLDIPFKKERTVRMSLKKYFRHVRYCARSGGGGLHILLWGPKVSHT